MNLKISFLFLATLTSCAQASHPTVAAGIGAPVRWSDVVTTLHQPGPVELTRVVAADWVVPRSGLINLEHPDAQAAGLEDQDEPIQVFFYALRHPTQGLFIVDTGVDRATATRDTDAMAASWLVRTAMNLEALRVHVDTRTWIEQQQQPLAGVFLTHLHLDHAMGLPDVPTATPVYTGPGEAADAKFMYMFSRSTTASLLADRPPLRELHPQPSEGSPFAGALDVFGDGSLIALHVPGHTQGSLAYLVRSTQGPVLLVGDACHTAWGWDHGVEPGSFNTDGAQSRHSLERLLRFAAEHPSMAVHLGHQPHARNGSGR